MSDKPKCVICDVEHESIRDHKLVTVLERQIPNGSKHLLCHPCWTQQYASTMTTNSVLPTKYDEGFIAHSIRAGTTAERKGSEK